MQARTHDTCCTTSREFTLGSYVIRNTLGFTATLRYLEGKLIILDAIVKLVEGRPDNKGVDHRCWGG